MIRVPLNKVCDYRTIAITEDRYLQRNGRFDPAFPDKAESCGTKVLIGLSNQTEDILGPEGGLDLARYEARVSFYKGKIDPYVERGVIVRQLVVDEPHDCHDWVAANGQGTCPTLEQVDKAAAIDKRLWPTLPTVVNTIAPYLNGGVNSGYSPKSIDGVMFMFAYHKYGGDSRAFVKDSVAAIPKGSITQLSWALQIGLGGGATYAAAPMTAAQVRETGTAMCDTGKGQWIVAFYPPIQRAKDSALSQAVTDLGVRCARAS